VNTPVIGARTLIPEPPRHADEHDTLVTFLDYFRSVFARKMVGLSHEQLHTPLPPSTLTLGRLLKHLAFVESYWFEYVFSGAEPREPWASADWEHDPDWEMTSSVDDSPTDLIDLYDDAVARAQAVVASASGFDQLAARDGGPNLRWILVHMIEEYARHCGHADFLREAIDGQVGD
jgi:hypothetical protein